MTQIKGGPAGPDGAGGAYQNTTDDDRAALWSSMGARQGILRGFDWSTVAGQMVMEFTAGSALVEERDATGNPGTNRGYHVWADTTTTVTFDPADASARNDAVVVAFCDSEDGSLGAGVSEVGPQIVVVRGVAGVSTPRTDAEINDWVGAGGWFRYLDVPIAAGATQINAATVVKATGAMAADDTGWIDLGEPISGFALPASSDHNPRIRRIGRQVWLRGYVVLPSGGSFGATGNWLDLWQLGEGFVPPSTPAGGFGIVDIIGASSTVGPVVAVRVGTGGLVAVANIGTTGMSPGDQLALPLTWRTD